MEVLFQEVDGLFLLFIVCRVVVQWAAGGLAAD
jgi:hypothetical protein